MKKSIFCCLIFSFALITSVFSSDNTNNKKLEEMTVQELRLYRNLQFARHGYNFKNQDLQEYFNQFEWYNPKESNEEIKLSKEEEKIVNECLKLEKAKSDTAIEKDYLNNFFGKENFKKETYIYNNETYILAYNEIGTVRDIINYDKLVISTRAVIYKVVNGKVNVLLVIDGSRISTNEKLLFDAKMPQEFYGWNIKIVEKPLKVYATPYSDEGKNTTDSIDFILNDKGNFERVDYMELYKDLY